MLKTIVLLSFALLLTACGFTPMYGQGSASKGNVPAGLDRVEIAMIPDESGIYLRNELIDRFYRSGYPASPTHKLVVSPVAELIRDLDITIESEATRKQIKLTTSISLVDNQTEQSVMSRTLSAITSYNVSPTQFTTRLSESDAREAALTDLARQIEVQTALYFKK